MEKTFKEHGHNQAIVSNDHPDVKDELITTLSGDHVRLTITRNEEEIATFLLYAEQAQQLFHWLMIKRFVS